MTVRVTHGQMMKIARCAFPPKWLLHPPLVGVRPVIVAVIGTSLLVCEHVDKASHSFQVRLDCNKFETNLTEHSNSTEEGAVRTDQRPKRIVIG